MTARLRDLLDRPIHQAARRRAFALAATVLVLAAIALLLLGRSRPQMIPPPPLPPRIVAVPTVSPPTIERTQAVDSPSARGEKPARRFLTGYLRYLYGRGRAGQIRGADRHLVRRLARTRPRASPALQQRRPRVVELRARPRGDRTVVRALVDDGDVARYPIELTVRRIGGKWVVAEVAAH